jgi:error-prone DNA polymerase
VEYPHPDLEPILARTLGVPLFQEQLMRVAMVAAGFTGGQAEELRRAMGSKRSVERMQVLEAQLREGMARNGYSAEAQEQVVRGISSFALYGFPESHAASFALLAYASAYIKCHFPASFACALLNQWPMGFYHPSTVLKDAQRHGVRALPIDVTRSAWACTREDDPRPGGRGAVRLGLKYVHGLREHVGRAIESERARRPFASIDDLARRTGARGAELTALAELGALAALPRGAGEGRTWTRRSALWQVQVVAAKPPGGLFARADALVEPSPLAEMTLRERVAADYRGSGLTVGRHPMALAREALSARGVLTVAAFLRAPNHAPVAVAGAVIVRQRPPTAKGFFFITIEDETGIANAIVAPPLFEAERAVMVGAPLVVLHGVVQHQDGATSLKVVHAEPLALAPDDPAMPASHDFH